MVESGDAPPSFVIVVGSSAAGVVVAARVAECGWHRLQ